MIKFKLKQYSYATESEGLDWFGKKQLEKLRNKQAKDLKKYKKLGGNLNSGKNIIGANNLAREAAEKTRREALAKIKESSAKRVKWGKRGAIAGLAIGTGYAMKKIYDEQQQDNS